MESDHWIAAASAGSTWASNFWFWAAVALFWLIGLRSVCGVPRKLARTAATEVEAARLTYDVARYRMGPGRIVPLGFASFRWPVIGACAAYAAANAVYFGAAPLATAAAILPVWALDVALEPRALKAVSDLKASNQQDEDFLRFGDAMAELARLRPPAIIAAVVLTLVVAAAFG